MPGETPLSLRALLAHSIDYAGLFPPASLDMPAAVRNYDAYRTGPHAWLLGRFVVPLTRLDEFADAAHGLLPQNGNGEPWLIAAIFASDASAQVVEVERFNAAHAPSADAGHAVIDTLELKARSPDEIAGTAERLPRPLRSFFEIPLDVDAAPFARAAAGAGVGIKARTGGVTTDAFPPAVQLASFLSAATGADCRYKVTAGLHHLMRGEYRLTYERDAPCGTMFGFLNVFAAAVAAAAGSSGRELTDLLTETDPAAITFSDAGICWRGIELPLAAVSRTRRLLAAFGSCSFTEPVEELTAAGLIA